MSPNEQQPLVLDATVLVNFILTERIDLLSTLGRKVYCPCRAWEEAIAKQRLSDRELETLRERGQIRVVRVDEPELVLKVADLEKYLGLGEAEALVMCSAHGYVLASDRYSL